MEQTKEKPMTAEETLAAVKDEPKMQTLDYPATDGTYDPDRELSNPVLVNNFGLKQKRKTNKLERQRRKANRRG